mmetsp:Transcript_15798/g.23016  ORF Transcript_15798/g.23016 Transcript_15798/m.23016 type:complete len:186 (-) Transcript_15798:1300-1857(-)
MRISCHRLDGHHAEEDPLKRKQVCEMLGQMPSLKELHIDDRCDNLFPDMYLRVPSIERLTIYSNSLENIIHRGTPSLKTLELNMAHLLNFQNFHFNLENVEKFEIIVSDGEVTDDEYTKVVALVQNIEQRMPALESFKFDYQPMHDWDELTFVLKSKSLKKVYISDRMLDPFEFDCPALEELNPL